MEKKYSVYSLVLIVIGIFIAIMGFPPINIDFLEMWGILIGFSLYLVGLLVGAAAFVKKETGFLKYISAFSVLFGVLYIAFLVAIVGRM